MKEKVLVSNKKYNVHLILEGNEEICLFNIAKKYGVHENIDLTFTNAGGFGTVAAYYQSEMNNEEHDCNLCVYDVDYRQNEDKSPYNHIQEQLLLILGEKEMVDKISFCTNPNILQILLLGCDEINQVKLMSGAKKDNTELVHKYWNEIGRQKDGNRTKYYDAKEWQLRIISNSFEYGPYNYETLYNNCASISNNYLTFEPGSNLFELLKALKEGDIDISSNHFYFENLIISLKQHLKHVVKK